MIFSNFSPLSSGALLALLLALTGCNNVNTGNTGGRVDPYRTTGADQASDKANIPSMLEFSDTVAEKLAMDITSLPAVKEAKTRLILELGMLSNKTVTTPTSDFEMIQQRLRNKLINSKLITDHFKIVASRSQINAELDRINGTPGAPGTDAAKYDPQISYVLSGDFYEANRGNGAKRHYYFQFQIIHLGTRDIIYSKDLDVALVR